MAGSVNKVILLGIFGAIPRCGEQFRRPRRQLSVATTESCATRGRASARIAPSGTTS